MTSATTHADLRVVVIGAGAGGMAAAVRMLQDGVGTLHIFERSDGVGGVWRANTYPGSQCDVPSHLYSFSFYAKPDWSCRYPDQPELLAYFEETADVFGLRDHLHCRTEVESCTWDDTGQVWQVQVRALDTGKSAVHEADIVITATGQLSTPSVPQLPGQDDFAGVAFHSAQWRHDVDFTGRNVAIIGTGASTVQFIEKVSAEAGHVAVFQRSAPYIIPKANRRYPRLERWAYRQIPGLQKFSRARQYLWHEFLGLPFTQLPAMMRLPMVLWRGRMERRILDPELRAAVTPDYLMGCKRLLRAPDWYRTLSLPSVDLVTDHIASFTSDGILTKSGQHIDADIVIWGTGFDATQFLTPMQVYGTHGQSLHDRWSNGAHAYLGTCVPGFPNFFLLYGPGTNVGHSSILVMIEAQIRWVRSAVRTMLDSGWSSVDIRPEVFSRYDQKFRDASAGTVWETGCTSWYTVDGRNTNNWPGTTLGFRKATRSFRSSDAVQSQASPRQVTGARS